MRCKLCPAPTTPGLLLLLICKTGKTCTQKRMLCANCEVKIFFSSAANLWSFCICFALKRTCCKCNQHIKVHLSSEDREQGGSLSHPSPCHRPADLGALHACGVLCLGIIIIIIIPSFPLPVAKIPSLFQGTLGKSTGLKHFPWLCCWRCGPVASRAGGGRGWWGGGRGSTPDSAAPRGSLLLVWWRW